MPASGIILLWITFTAQLRLIMRKLTVSAGILLRNKIPTSHQTEDGSAANACETPTEKPARKKKPTGVSKANAAKTHCKHGHEFTPDNTYHPPAKPHTRRCRQCIRAALKRYDTNGKERVRQPALQGLKRCYRCNEFKPLAAFNADASNSTGVGSRCKPCHLEYKRKTGMNRVYKYGLSSADYLEMLEQQADLCAICGKADPAKALAIDHCHVTGVVRGLLCHNCNVGLGNFRDDDGLLYKAMEYLWSAYRKSQEPPGDE